SKEIYKYLLAKKSCFFKGINYSSGEKITRRHRCHHCLCDNGRAVLHLLKAVQSSHTKEYAIHPFITAYYILKSKAIPERNATLYVKSRRRQKSGVPVRQEFNVLFATLLYFPEDDN
ncbi:unnamed protein product, partial [Medioppia subpectinata]